MKVEIDHITRTLASRDKFYKALYERPESFSKLLPYEEYDKETGIYVLADGSLGAIFRIGLHEHEAMAPASIVSTVEDLKSWLTFSERYCIQVIFDQSFVPARDGVWREIEMAYPDAHPAAQQARENRAQWMREACEREVPHTPLKRDAYLTIRFFPDMGGGTDVGNLVGKSERMLFGEMREVSKQLKEFSQTLQQLMQSSKTILTQVTGAELTESLRRFFNPKEYFKRDFAPYNADRRLADQIIFAAPFADPKGLTREGIRTRTITLKMSPRRVFAGGTALFTKLTFPFRIALNFSFPPKAKTKSYFDIKEFFLQNSPSARAHRQLSELKEVQTRLAHDERCLYMTFLVVIEGENDDVLDRRSRSLTAVFHNDLECEVVFENDIGFGMCMNSLPLLHSPAADHSSQRHIPILAKDAAFLLPVFGSFMGHPRGGLQIFMSRENNVVPMTTFGNETSQHTIYCGDTGSGKSVLAIENIRTAKLRSPEPIVFIIDKKESCKALCKEFDGELTVFSQEGDLPFTPFRGEFDDAKVAFLTQLILTGLKLTSEKFNTDSRQTTVISRAIKEAYMRRARELGVNYENGELVFSGSTEAVSISMDDVVASLGSLTSIDEFEKMKDIIDEPVTGLMPFYGDGIYAKYFRGQAKGSKRKKPCLLYAYDLDAFDNDEVLKVLMSMSVMHEIMTIKRRPEHIAREAIVEIEEIGRFGKNNSVVSEFAIDLAETSRKLKIQLHALAPDPRAFFNTDAGRALFAAADNFYFGRMSPDNIRYLSENSALFDPTTSELASTLEIKADVYSEFLYMNKSKSVIGAFRFWKAP